MKIKIHLMKKYKLKLIGKYISRQKCQQSDLSQECDLTDTKMNQTTKNRANILPNKAVVIMELTNWLI